MTIWGIRALKQKNTFHAQSYYPYGLPESSYGFLEQDWQNNFYDQNGDGSYWVGKSYEFGYADNARIMMKPPISIFLGGRQKWEIRETSGSRLYENIYGS